MAGRVLVACASVSMSDRYTVDLANFLTDRQITVTIAPLTAVDSNLSTEYTTTPIPSGMTLLSNLDRVRLVALKKPCQQALELLMSDHGTDVVIFVMKDAENRFDVDQQWTRPSIFVLSLNYDNIPKTTRKIMTHFDVIVPTGLNAQAATSKALGTRPTSVVFPRFLTAAQHRPDKKALRAAMGLNPDKFVFLLDINECLEIKSFDTVIKAFVQCIQSVPDFQRDALLVVNAYTTVQLVNVLKLETLTPNEINIFVPYYADGHRRDDTLLERLIECADVVVNVGSGGDFDVHANLAQQCDKLVLYTDTPRNREYYPFGLRVGETQVFYDGLAQGFLNLPAVGEVAGLLRQAFLSRHRLKTNAGARKRVQDFKMRHDRFAERWSSILSGYLL
ncbi:hypothetical protein CVIRNUC_003355 [Coccomyxa viridis]|uniref:Uncharacterized protein n=1 Tax=Coccomyxa viridis TaxID=1274662 RepID=A0AAV1I1F0_9CHLO|nr:hypothetical protein CVIRNUC_003355 [Coccomyxa viridis]